MKKLVLLSAAFLTTVSLLTSCGEKGTGNATECASDCATKCEKSVDSTVNATDVVADTTKN